MSRANKVLIVGELRGEAVVLKSILLETRDFDVTLATTGESAFKLIKDELWDLILVNDKEVSLKHLEVLKEARKANSEVPLLTVAHHISIETFRCISEMGNSLVLMRPFSEKDLLVTVRKMCQGENVPRRHQPRFNTSHMAHVELEREHLLVVSQMKNFSSGGAFLSVSRNYFSIGDTVYLDVETRDNRKLRIKATVRWVQDSPHWKKGQGVGVEFTHPNFEVNPISDLNH